LKTQGSKSTGLATFGLSQCAVFILIACQDTKISCLSLNMPKTNVATTSASSALLASNPMNGFSILPNVSTPAYIMMIAYIIVGIVILLPFELKVYNDVTQEFEIIEYNLAHRVLLILYLLLPVCLHIYSVNCMMVGNCTIWSYVYTLIHVIWILVFIIIAFSYAFGRK